MRTFSIYTLGCKVNQYESQQITQLLEQLGLSAADSGQKPDLAVINTCCVTETASAKSRHYIQRALKANPAGVRMVCGCLPAMNSREIPPCDSDNVHIISSRDDLVQRIAQIIIGGNPLIKAKNGLKIKDGIAKFAKYPKLPKLSNFKGHTRAFLKVQDGCDGLCTYCIVPKVRPTVQSKPLDEAISEAKAFIAAGHKEIVVIGVNLGAYGRSTTKKTKIDDYRPVLRSFQNGESEGGWPIVNLLKSLAQIPGLNRIRLSSLEPADISDELLDVFCAHPNIMPHIHLSVQSGSSATLKRMCRRYDAEELRAKIELIKRRLDRPAITADIIVGFPGETADDFKETVELSNWAGFSKIHVFPFSVRTGTPAAKLKDRLPENVIKTRADILRKVSDDLGHKFVEQFVGQTCEVLIEGSKDKQSFGHCERYFLVQVKSDCGFKKNQIVSAKITAATSEGTTGIEDRRQ
jgi:threonylcarbamoyladenosine tRNA methylthiotransferase MtaB